MEEMDDRLKSRLMPELIEFKPYNVNETHGILKQRVEYAFYPGVWETNAFEEVVKKTASLQDMRAGVHLLKDAGNYAEAKASKKITKDHVAHVVGKVDEFVSIKSTGLEEEDREIINLVRKNSNVKIGDLYKIYTEAGGQMSYRTFQRRMGDFEEKGFVKLTKSTGEGGNTTLVEYKERTKSLNEF
jgi:cell division control protein 6